MRQYLPVSFIKSIAGLILIFLLTIFAYTSKAIAKESIYDSPSNFIAQSQIQSAEGLIEDDAPVFILQNFYLSGNESLLTARLNITVSNISYLRNILRDGARLKLECKSALYRKRTFWRNNLMQETEFSSSLRYNPLQREFFILSDNAPALYAPTLSMLLENTWGNLELPLGEISELEKGESYVAVVTLALKHEEMPPWLGKNVFFWSDVIIPAKEYTLEFNY